MPKNALPLPALTPAQKTIVAEHYMMDLADLTRKVFGNDSLDRRSIECKAVKIELSLQGKTDSRGVSALATATDLAPEHQEYVRNNYKNASPLEMARTLFVDETIMINSPETHKIDQFCRIVDSAFRAEAEIVKGPYEPPKNFNSLMNLVNRYAINPRQDGKPLYDQEHLSNQDQKELRALLAYMKTPLFKIEGDKYVRKTDRELFESTFISFCWNKPDLMAEEVHQYIAVAAETVKYTQIDRTVIKLDERLISALESPQSEMRMTEVELLNTVREKSNASMSKIAALLKILVGNRAERLKDRIQSSASMHNLVSMWQKEDDRKKLIQLASKFKASLATEVTRLSDMDSLKVEMFGLNKADILR